MTYYYMFHNRAISLLCVLLNAVYSFFNSFNKQKAALQSNLAILNSVNSKSPLFRRKIECPWIYPSPLRFPGCFEAPLFRTFFHFPWDLEIAGFDCIYKMGQLHV